jgi:hypothetical protein
VSVLFRAYGCVAVALSAVYYLTPDSPPRSILWVVIAMAATLDLIRADLTSKPYVRIV